MADERRAVDVLKDTGSADSPVPVPDGSDRNTLHLRLLRLQGHSRRAAGNIFAGAMIASVLVLGAMSWGGIQLARELALGGIGPLPIPSSGMLILNIILGIELLMLCVVVVWMVVMAVMILLKAPGMYESVKAAALEDLHTTSIGVVVADDELWQRIADRFRRGWRGIFNVRHNYRGVDDHFIFCACHWPSVQRLADWSNEISRFRFHQCHQCFNTLRWFYRPKTYQIVLGCIFGTLLSVHLIAILPILLVFHGMRYINAYARMNALCEFFLGEYGEGEES